MSLPLLALTSFEESAPFPGAPSPKTTITFVFAFDPNTTRENSHEWTSWKKFVGPSAVLTILGYSDDWSDDGELLFRDMRNRVISGFRDKQAHQTENGGLEWSIRRAEFNDCIEKHTAGGLGTGAAYTLTRFKRDNDDQQSFALFEFTVPTDRLFN